MCYWTKVSVLLVQETENACDVCRQRFSRQQDGVYLLEKLSLACLALLDYAVYSVEDVLIPNVDVVDYRR